MKTTVIPAQVTTVEDRIAGNLTFSQLLLMTAPVFLSGIIFAFLPPFMNIKGYKLLTCIAILIVFFTLAIRIKGRIVLSWISLLGRYRLRPRYFIFNKNDLYLRNVEAKTDKIEKIIQDTESDQEAYIPVSIPIGDLVLAEKLASNPLSKLEFKATRKGDLRVYIQEIK